MMFGKKRREWRVRRKVAQALEVNKAFQAGYEEGQQDPPGDVVLARVDMPAAQDAAYGRGWRDALTQVAQRASWDADVGAVPTPYTRPADPGDRIIAAARREAEQKNADVDDRLNQEEVDRRPYRIGYEGPPEQVGLPGQMVRVVDVGADGMLPGNSQGG